MKWLPILLMTVLILIACNREEGSGNDNAEETNAPSSSDREKAATELQQAWAQSRPDQGRSQQQPQGGPDPVPAPSDVASPPGDARRTDSGLAYKVLKTGDGQEHPGARDEVTVHYTGWTTDGNMFDSSVTRGQPATFPLNRVIGGWTEG
ncbi:MAG: FKBP-type peptidyl-prolyl cis-trans isomerase, partial [Myxococcota bacterium]